MMSSFKKGDFLFRQGDASDSVMRVMSGEIEILREIGTSSILLGRVRAGEWLGEMGVIENRSRSATAHATKDSEVEILTARQFMEQVSGDPTLAHDLILRLSIRLREIENKVADDLLQFLNARFPNQATVTAPDMVIANDATISITAQSDALRALIGAKPIRIAKLPFLVGRPPAEGEPKPSQRLDLVIKDQEPFRLSRQHFMIARRNDRVFVSDVGSTLGTIVNGQAIGHHFMRDAAPLHRGENHILAGGLDSPFQFLVSID